RRTAAWCSGAPPGGRWDLIHGTRPSRHASRGQSGRTSRGLPGDQPTMAATVTLTIPDPRRGRARLLLLGLAVAGLLAVTTASSLSPRPSLAADSTTPEHTISVSGTGR